MTWIEGLGPDADGGEDAGDDKQIVLSCGTCGGKGSMAMASPPADPPQPPVLALCPECKGSKCVTVRLGDVRLKILMPADSPGGMRPMLTVTHAGKASLGEPLEPTEAMHLARTVDTNGQHVVLLFTLSELARARRELEAVRASHSADIRRLERELQEARIDIGAATGELRRAREALRGGG